VRFQRGQTIFETAIFLPLMLGAMFSIIYFSQYGVLQERAFQASRFSSLVSNSSATSGFTLQNLYHELHREGADQTDPGFPSSALSCATTAASDGVNALTQGESLPSGHPGPTAPPYFQPDTGTASAESGCTAYHLSLTNTSVNSSSNWYYVLQYTHVEADKTAPTWLSSWIPAIQGGHVKAGMSNVRADPPDSIIYCSPPFAAAIAKSLGAIEPAPIAGPFAGYKVPPVGAPHSC
jgi:hypothetical protein